MRVTSEELVSAIATPALTTVAPSLVSPRASSSSIHVPDSRVSRPMTNRRDDAGDDDPRGDNALLSAVALGAEAERVSIIALTIAAPTRDTVGRSSGAVPALPRMPSVPNSFMVVRVRY